MDHRAVSAQPVWTVVDKRQDKADRGNGTHLVLVVERSGHRIESNVSGATWDAAVIGEAAPRLIQTDEAEKEVLRTENAWLRKRIAELENAIVLTGWKCPACKGFNGEEKQRHDTCIYCPAPRPA